MIGVGAKVMDRVYERAFPSRGFGVGMSKGEKGHVGERSVARAFTYIATKFVHGSCFRVSYVILY